MLGALNIPFGNVAMLLLGLATWSAWRRVGLLSLTLSAIGWFGLPVGLVLLALSGHGGGAAERLALYPKFVWTIVLGVVFVYEALLTGGLQPAFRSARTIFRRRPGAPRHDEAGTSDAATGLHTRVASSASPTAVAWGYQMIWNEASETMPRERIDALQLERLRTTVGRLLRSVAPTAERLHAAGVRSERDVASLADLARLPFSHKRDLREQYPDGLFAVPMEQIVRIHASSGTRGKPTVVGYTRADLGVWSEVMARCLAIAGVGPGTVVHNAYGYGLFTGGLGIHQGAELIGATVIPMSGGFTARQILMLRDLGGQVLVLHAVVRAQPGAGAARAGGRSGLAAPPDRHLRRRALDRRDAHHPGARLGLSGARRLRALRDRRPGCRGGVP